MRDGKYGMFIHWGLYSHLGGKWRGQDFYGIGEWIKRQMEISNEDYMAIADEFNPVDFDAKAIVATAKAAGMKYIIITSKHHDGFAMFDSAYPFNIVDQTPFGRDPMKELAEAAQEAGLKFGFYYSHFQDWTAPGGGRGPKQNPDGSEASFEQYFREKCYPQVKEICTNYGPLSFIWFDTPGPIERPYVEELVELVRETQPNALMCSRVGHGMGDYKSLGDMEVPLQNHEGVWESCDTTNDSWSYAWYDQNWKDAQTILHRLIGTVGRGGTYLLNVGPDGSGRIPQPAVDALEAAGAWLALYPDLVYSAGSSPWGMAQPWGDITTQENALNLIVFDWPADRKIHLYGLKSTVESAVLRLADGAELVLPVEQVGDWTELDASQMTTEQLSGLASVIRLGFAEDPKVNAGLSVHPNLETELAAVFAEVDGARQKRIGWMEKFGEWKHVTQVDQWSDSGTTFWDVNFAEAGDYYVELSYRGEGRVVWAVDVNGEERIRNQQAASSVYHTYRMGLVRFSEAGKQRLSVRLIDGDREDSSLLSLRLVPVNL